MDEKLEKDIEKYLKKVGRYIICEKETKKKLLAEINDSVYSYAEECGISSMDEIYKKFGTPKALASVHLSHIDPDKVMTAFKIKKILLATLSVMLVMLAVFFVSTFIDAHKSHYADLDCLVTEDATINIIKTS